MPGVPDIMVTEAQEADAQGTLQATVSVSDLISSSALAAKAASLRGRHQQARAQFIELREAHDKLAQAIYNKKTSGDWSNSS